MSVSGLSTWKRDVNNPPRRCFTQVDHEDVDTLLIGGGRHFRRQRRSPLRGAVGEQPRRRRVPVSAFTTTRSCS